MGKGANLEGVRRVSGGVFRGEATAERKGYGLQLFGCCADEGLSKAKQAMSDGDGDDGELRRKGKKKRKKEDTRTRRNNETRC